MAIRPSTLLATAALGAFIAVSGSHGAVPQTVPLKSASVKASVAFLASPDSYTVQPGNTLGSIAAEFHTTVAALVSLNHLANPNLIQVGEVITLGTNTSTQAATATAGPSFTSSYGSYTVQPGNTLSGIAAQYHTTVATLVAINHLSNPNALQVGQVLQVSGAASQAPASAPTTSGSSRSYTVQPGNTLGQIASQFGMSWQTLAAVNHLSNPNALQVGQVLSIPASGTAGASVPVASAPVSFGQAIRQTALSYLGVPYVWGGTSPAGFDCSGLVQYVFGRNGVSIPRTSYAQYAASTKIAKSQLAPGDLVFFSASGPGASHVGIYIGSYPPLGYSQAFVEAPAPGQTVMVSNLNSTFYTNTYYGAGYFNP